jgi:hypothetical protein
MFGSVLAVSKLLRRELSTFGGDAMADDVERIDELEEDCDDDDAEELKAQWTKVKELFGDPRHS